MEANSIAQMARIEHDRSIDVFVFVSQVVSFGSDRDWEQLANIRSPKDSSHCTL